MATPSVPTTEANPADPSVQYASRGSGPLLQRSYTGTIEGSSLSPEQVADLVRKQFADFAPSETVAFKAEGRAGTPLQVGDEMNIRISGMIRCKVRVIHTDARSLTLRTLSGHPEAGRITFGALRDDSGRLLFRIQSRARSGGLLHYLGYLLLGRTMQGRCWIRFVGRVAQATGGKLSGPVRVRSETVPEEEADCGITDAPTFCCQAGE